MPKISVIVPVFNGENTIYGCLNSLAAQTFEDFEVVIIDDGSTDNTAAICREFSDFKYYYTENHGLSLARNLGLSKAKGDYVFFADCDDYLDTAALKTMFSKAQEAQCDILICGYFAETPFGIKEIKSVSRELDLIELKEKKLLDPVWNKLYRTDFLNSTGTLMPEGEILEDTFFNLSLLKCNPKITVFDDCLYYYTFNFGSITHSYDTRKIPTIKKRALLLKELLTEDYAYCDYYYIRSVFSAFTDMFLALNKKEITDLIKTEISTTEFKNATRNGKYTSFISKVLLIVAKTENPYIIYAFCKLCYILKFKAGKA